jgi:presqualene diphosphate synthase
VTEADPFQAAIRIARASKSPMERAALALDGDRYKIFCATYASMRVIDDYVDDDFLARPAADRAAARPEALGVTQAWRAGAVAALADGASPAPTARFAETTSALAATHVLAGLDPTPWNRLAGAMARDINEAPMPDWPDFLAYAEGATAAPAAVFVETLALRKMGDGRLWTTLEKPAVETIRNSAVLLYLVHIMRDLAEDAAKGAELLTLPDTLFAEFGTSRNGFASDAANDADLVSRVRKGVAQYAEQFLEPAQAELIEFGKFLTEDEADILLGLCLPYIEKYERFAAQP